MEPMKVKIKTWEKMKSKYGLDEDGDIFPYPSFLKEMEKALPENRIIEIDGHMNWKGYTIGKYAIAKQFVDDTEERKRLEDGDESKRKERHLKFVSTTRNVKLFIETQPRYFIEWEDLEAGVDTYQRYERRKLGNVVWYENAHNRGGNVPNLCYGDPLFEILEELFKEKI